MRLSSVFPHLLVLLSVLSLSRPQTTPVTDTTTDFTTYTTDTTTEATTETTTETTTESTTDTTTTESTTETTTETTTESTTETTTDTTTESTTETTTDTTTESTTETTTESTTDTTTTESTTETTTETTTDTTTESTTETTTESTTDTTTTESTTETTTETTTESTTETTTDTTTESTTETTTETTTESTTETTTESTTETTTDTTTESTTETTTESTTDTTTTESTTETTTETTTESTTETTTDTTTESTTLTAAITTTSWPAPAIFYPFGSAAGDTVHVEIGHDSSINVAFSTPFTFFGYVYNSVYVNNNGLLTFNQAFIEDFPTAGSEDFITPLWTDLDDLGIGRYSYQQYTNGSVLARATQDINQYFPNMGFTASWVFVVTWDYVQSGDINVLNVHAAPAFTFQAVLISNGGNFSFVLMNYGECADIGLTVKTGYDTKGSKYYNVSDYYPPDLMYKSNVNVPGRLAYILSRATDIVGVQIKLKSFLDLTQSENYNFVLQKVKEILNRSDGVSRSFELKLRKVQKI